MARGVLAAVGMANSVMALGAWGVIRPIWLSIVRVAHEVSVDAGDPRCQRSLSVLEAGPVGNGIDLARKSSRNALAIAEKAGDTAD